MMNKKAFTLIELLVVVLIIGILAAVALPRYEKAVEKSRMTEASIMLSGLMRSMDAYLLENPTPTDFLYFLGDSSNATDALVFDVSNLDCSGSSCKSKYFAYTAYYDFEFKGTEVKAQRYDSNANYHIRWYKSANGTLNKSCTPYNQAGQNACDLFKGDSSYAVYSWI